YADQDQPPAHRGKHPRPPQRSTLPALRKLAARAYMAAEQDAALAGAYRFLRDVEHKLQIVHERQTHLVPRDAGEIAALARRLGFRGADAVARFWAAHARQTAVVHEAFAALFHGPAEERRRERDPEIDALLEGLDDAPATHARLERLGSADPTPARRELPLPRDGPPHAPGSARAWRPHRTSRRSSTRCAASATRSSCASGCTTSRASSSRTRWPPS